MKRIPLLAVILCAVLSVYAADVMAEGKETGKVEAQVKAMHILDEKNNDFGPTTGSGYLVKIKYVTPKFYDLKVGFGHYTNGDTGLTDWDADEKPAKGMFVSDRGHSESLLGEAYLEYNIDKFNAQLGRQILNTPMTRIKWSLMPNFYTAYVFNTTAIPDFSLTAGQITHMSFGSRTMTDWGLIGEQTKTAGTAVDPDIIGQAEFHGISEIANVTDDTNGITVVGATYNRIKNVKLGLWNYYADDIANTSYAQVDGTIPVGKTKVKLGAQYLNQKDTGDSLAGGLDFTLYGVKASLAKGKWSVYGAYNKSGDDGELFNAWGGDPAYTSSIFSRNEYRKDVSAYKVGFSYKVLNGLKFMASYADYGQSKTGLALNTDPSKQPQTDAKETDLVLVYKPAKDWMFKIFDAIRTSEYDGVGGLDKTQNHIRVIVSYNF